MCIKVLEGKDQWLCPDVQAGDDYDELQIFLRTLSAKNKGGDCGSKT